MFEALSIKNLRGIDNLKIADLSRINIFVGPNNSGKTTVLEALFLLIGMSNTQLYVGINNLRGLTSIEENDLRLNFRDLDFQNRITLEAYDSEDGNRKLEITPQFSDKIVEQVKTLEQVTESNNLAEALRETALAETSISQKATGLNYEYSRLNGEENSYNSALYFDRGALKITLNPEYKEKLAGRFVNSQTFYNTLSDKIDRIQRDKRKDELISFLKAIDHKVQDIALARNGLVYIDIGISQMIPINLMGDGFLKACEAMATVLLVSRTVSEEGFLLIDEIENGLHYKTLKLLWKSMIEASQSSNVQMFIATHSYEAIKVLVAVMSKNNYSKEDIRLYSLAKTDMGIHRIYKYAFENLEASIESDVEIRGQ